MVLCAHTYILSKIYAHALVHLTRKCACEGDFSCFRTFWGVRYVGVSHRGRKWTPGADFVYKLWQGHTDRRMPARFMAPQKPACLARSFPTRTRMSTSVCCGVAACTWVAMVCVAAYHEHTIRVTKYGHVGASETSSRPMLSSVVRRRKPPLLCFIITMNASLPAVRVSAQLTCHPFPGSRTTAEILTLVSPRVRANLLANTSSWGADFTNNQSVSIAYNHIQLWRRLASQTSEADMLIFEDDILVNARALQLYNKIHRSGVLPWHNFILKLVNHHRMTWLGGSELRFVYKFWLQDRIFTLQQCVCRTRQNFLSSAAYVIDREAARVLLQHHLPMQSHVDIFMHYVGCRFSNFFVLDVDAVDFSGRKSKHDLASDHTHRMLASFKEQVKNMILTTCY